MSKLASATAAIALTLALAGCETSKGPGGDPGAKPLPAGSTCQTLRAELNKMDASGAQSKVERASKGKVDPATQSVADRYNQLLNQYLGARCHT
jgi:hypothetical protein